MQKADLICLHLTHYLGLLLTFIGVLPYSLLIFPAKTLKNELHAPAGTHGYYLNTAECDFSIMV